MVVPGGLDVSVLSAGKMPRARTAAPILLRKPEAAAVMGMSVDSYERYVQPEIRVVRRGALVLAPVSELERWVEANAERTLP